MKKIGLMGGTFDPIHLGHLLVAEQAREFVDLDEVWFVPAGKPPHKWGSLLTPSYHRLEMVKLGIADNPFFRCLDIEVTKETTSYTIDTVQTLKRMYPTYQYYLILGTDMVRDLARWHKVDLLLESVSVIAMRRIDETIQPVMNHPMNECIWVSGGAETNLSSTWLRGRLQQGLSVRYMIPEKVWYYIKEHHLYEAR